MNCSLSTVPRPPSTLIRPSRGFASLRLRELWEYRELLFFLIWRDVLVRYKQTVLGVSWALFRPLITTLLLSYVFGRLARLPTGDVPYPLFCICGILPWSYFSEAVSGASGSLIGNQNLISKVYFPRLIIPLTAVGRGLVDLACSFVVLIGMLWWYDVRPSLLPLAALPLLVLLAFVTALGVGLWFSALSVRFRDLTHVLPFVVQIWFWITPVAYGSNLVPESLRWLHWLNPLTGVVEGFRWAILGKGEAPGAMVFVSAITVALLLAGGLFFFRHQERQFADVI